VRMYERSMLDYLIIPGIRQSKTIIKYISGKPSEINLSLVKDKGVIWWRNNDALSIRECFSDLRSHLRLSDEKWKGIKKLEAKREFVEAISRLGAGLSEQDYEYLKERYQSVIKNRRSVCFTAKTASRLQIGGKENVLETKLLLHRLFGFPIIPGSAIKGMALAALFHEKKLVGKKRVDNHGRDISLNTVNLYRLRQNYPGDFTEEIVMEIRELFGSPAIPDLKMKEQAGKVIFLDAWPEQLESDLIDLDSWTVHYPNYYKEKNTIIYPGDDDNPSPLLQLCVKKGAAFRFVLLSKEGAPGYLLKKVKRYLQLGLEHLGVGAKPDYGYFYNFMDL